MAEGQRCSPDLTRCSQCGDPAVYHNRQTGDRFCGTHLIADVEARVAETIRDKGMIAPGDRVAVGLSGGKDSTALLLVLSRIFASAGDATLVAITVDEGIHGYREETVRSAERLVRDLGIEHRCVSFRELFGNDLDGILKGRESRACTICGILRKKALADAARDAGATKLATGHNLDDEAQSVLMNVLRGDLPRLVRDSSAGSTGHFIPRIKPLTHVPEKEIALYLVLRGAWTDLPECPYAQHALRREARQMLAGLEYRHPGTMLNLLKSRDVVRRTCSGGEAIGPAPLHPCRRCGDPCSGDLCQCCSLLESLGPK